MKRYLPILKMAEDIFSNPQSDTKHQKLLECILTGNSKLYLGKVYKEEQLKKLSEEEVEKLFNPILPGGGGFRPLMFFFHHPETAQAMKLKLSDFKDTCLRHILQVIPGCYILRCYHGSKITKGTLQNLTQYKSEIFE